MMEETRVGWGAGRCLLYNSWNKIDAYINPTSSSTLAVTRWRYNGLGAGAVKRSLRRYRRTLGFKGSESGINQAGPAN